MWSAMPAVTVILRAPLAPPLDGRGRTTPMAWTESGGRDSMRYSAAVADTPTLRHPTSAAAALARSAGDARHDRGRDRRLGRCAWASVRSPGTTRRGRWSPGSDPLLPDLAMGPIEDIAVGTTDVGQQRLRFAATIVNIGEGALMVRARRPWVGGEAWAVEQWIELNGGGGYSARPTGGEPDLRGRQPQPLARQAGRGPPDRDARRQGASAGWSSRGSASSTRDGYRLELPGAPARGPLGRPGLCRQVRHAGPDGAVRRLGGQVPVASARRADRCHELPDGPYRIREIADPNDEFEEIGRDQQRNLGRRRAEDHGRGLRETTVVATGPPPKAARLLNRGARHIGPFDRASPGPVSGPY